MVLALMVVILNISESDILVPEEHILNLFPK